MKQQVIGLTGPSGAGKTIASGFLAKKGAFIINADAINHLLLATNQEAITAIHGALGDSVFTDQQIDRKKLGQLVFTNSVALDCLTAITYPFIREEISLLIQTNKDTPLLVIDAPTLIEAELHLICDEVWVILAAYPIRMERLLLRDAQSTTEIINRLNNQPQDSFYTAKATQVFYNNTSPQELEKKLTDSLLTIKPGRK